MPGLGRLEMMESLKKRAHTVQVIWHLQGVYWLSQVIDSLNYGLRPFPDSLRMGIFVG
jgi:hypothetical protein